MIAVDTSALMAILFDEPETDAMSDCLAKYQPLISPINFIEASIVSASRLKLKALDSLLTEFSIAIHPTDAHQAMIAREAYRRYGKGRHKARLNLGDCFAYALAAHLRVPLLYKGKDFDHTDITRAA